MRALDPLRRRPSTFWPVAIEPVTDISGSPGWSMSFSPTPCAAADDDVEYPLGKISAITHPSLSVVSGVISDGFRTIVLPAIEGRRIFQAAIING